MLLTLAGCSSQSQPLKLQPPAIQRAIIFTELGKIKIELYAAKAPNTVANFIRYVEAGAYDHGQFYRVVREDNDNGTPQIDVIQGKAHPSFRSFRPIDLETTQLTGLKHVDGTLSMARSEPHTAKHEFFICLGPQPSLDFGGQRNTDGQGFAAFGQVLEGMEIVKKIQQIRDAAEVEDDYTKGQILAQPVAILSIELVEE